MEDFFLREGRGGEGLVVSNERRVISRDCGELTTNALSMRGNHKYIRGGAEKFNQHKNQIKT